MKSPMKNWKRFGLFCVVFGVGAYAAAPASPTARYSVHETVTDEKIPLIVLRDAVSGIEAAVAPTQGGELSSLRIEFQGRWVELLYRGGSYKAAPGFRGKAPLLWPAVGSGIPVGAKPVNGKIESAYDYDGKRYPMPQHGFARSKPWRVLRSWANDSEAAVEVLLTDDADSRKQYPFGFEFRLIYRVTEGRVELQHVVKAAGDNTAPMFFSIGNHIALAVPLVAGSPLEGITLESPSRVEYLRGADTTPSGATREQSFVPAVSLKNFKAMPAISVGGYEGDPWFRLADAAGLAVRVSHHAQSVPSAPVVQFNLYGGTAEGFFCPEPFVGVQNSFNKRVGLIEVAPGKTWTWQIRVEPERKPF
jgi:galactose mutarotase-like enzyme